MLLKGGSGKQRGDFANHGSDSSRPGSHRGLPLDAGCLGFWWCGLACPAGSTRRGLHIWLAAYHDQPNMEMPPGVYGANRTKAACRRLKMNCYAMLPTRCGDLDSAGSPPNPRPRSIGKASTPNASSRPERAAAGGKPCAPAGRAGPETEPMILMFLAVAAVNSAAGRRAARLRGRERRAWHRAGAASS